MRALATYILKGPLQAVIVTALSSAMSLILPPFAHISGACIALVTLRKGLKDGLFVLAISGVILASVGMMSSINTVMVKVFLLAMVLVWWLPVGLTAAVLRYTRSLGLALLFLGALCMVIMSAFYLVIGDMPAWWSEVLPNLMQTMYKAANFGLTEQQLDQQLENMAVVMTGFTIAAVIYLTMINLFIARWLQAILFNPGGFRSEFYALKLDRRLGIFLVIIGAVSMFTSGNIANYALNLLILIAALYSLQGLAIVYAVAAALSAHIGWIIALYVLMFLALPYVMLALSCTALADNMLDIRARVKKRGSSS